MIDKIAKIVVLFSALILMVVVLLVLWGSISVDLGARVGATACLGFVLALFLKAFEGLWEEFRR